MYKFTFFIFTVLSVSYADVSHLGTNRQADGYHYEQPSNPFPSENEIVPQQTFGGRNDFNPPAFLTQQKPEEPVPQVVPEYIPPAASSALQDDGYHYQQPSIPFPSVNEIVPQQTFAARNDFNPPAFLTQQQPEEPAPQVVPEQPVPQEELYIPPSPIPVFTNVQEDGYHYEQPSIPFPSVNEIVPQQTFAARNDFNPPAFLAQQQPEEPASQVVPEAPTEYIPPVLPTVVTNLQEDGYHYEQPSVPFESQQSISGRNDFNPPAFLLAVQTEEPAPQEPVAEEQIPQEPVPEEQTPQEPAYEEPAPEEPLPVEPTREEPVQPAAAPVETNLQEDGYHYAQPSVPFIQPEPAQQYLPVAEPAPVESQPEISSHFDSVEPEPSYSLGPNGYNYRVPSRPFRF